MLELLVRIVLWPLILFGVSINIGGVGDANGGGGGGGGKGGGS